MIERDGLFHRRFLIIRTKRSREAAKPELSLGVFKRAHVKWLRWCLVGVRGTGRWRVAGTRSRHSASECIMGRQARHRRPRSLLVHIMSCTRSERGASSQCPVCGQPHKPEGREWNYKACGFTGHRDIVGNPTNEQVIFPCSVMYLRPDPSFPV